MEGSAMIYRKVGLFYPRQKGWAYTLSTSPRLEWSTITKKKATEHKKQKKKKENIYTITPHV